MALDNTSTEDTRKRFAEAMSRWKANNASHSRDEVMSGDNKSFDDSSVVDILDYLKARTQDIQTPKPINVSNPIPVNVVHANDNIIPTPTIPIPLPIKPVDSSSLIGPETLENVAHEVTLKEVVHLLAEILDGIKKATEAVIHQVLGLGHDFKANIKDVFPDEREKTGWAAQLVGKVVGFIKNLNPNVEKAVDKVSAFFSIIIESNKRSIHYLKGIFDTLSRQEKAESTDTENARKEIEEGPTSALEGMYGVVIKKGGYIDKAFTAVSSMLGIFKKIGDAASKSIEGENKGILTSILSSSGGIVSMVGRLLGVFGGIGGLVTSIVGGVAFSAIYAMFKHPEQLVGYFDAFARLFTDVMMPAFMWFNTEIMPVLAAAFAGLVYVGEKLMDSVGYWVNDKLIWLIGTGIPDVLIFFGRQIDTIWQTLKDVTLRIGGIFGVGPYADESVLENLIGIWSRMRDGVFEFLSIWVTELIHTFGMSDLFGLREGEGIYGRLTRLFNEDIPNYMSEIFDSMMVWLHEHNPIPTIQKKIGDFIDSIVGLIPTWDDMRKWALDSIPDWVPDKVKDWFKDQLGAPDQPQPTKPTPDVEPKQKPAQQMYDAPIGAWDRQALLGPVVVAPTFNDNSSKINNSNQSVSGGGGIGSTKPATDRWADITYKSGLF